MKLYSKTLTVAQVEAAFKIARDMYKADIWLDGIHQFRRTRGDRK